MKVYANTWCYRDYDRETAFKSIAKLGYSGVEIIAHGPCWHADTLDTSERRTASINLIKDLGMEVIAISPSTEYLVFDEDIRRQAVEHTMSMIDLTILYGVNLTRIFAGGSFPADKSRQECIDNVVKTLKPCVEYAKNRGVILAVESHGQFGTDIDALAEVIETIDSSSLGITLDTSNFYVNGVDPLKAIDVFNTRIYHTHLKDSIRTPESYAGTSVGEGNIDFPSVINKLNSIGYSGKYCVEYEGTEAPEIGLSKSMNYLREIILD